ncbi:MAG: hypothetical protein M3O33_17290 [Cyanobacteriota bacterium]|nr:hypothetical protein [Cyanobacteriota bacterium]
MKTLTMRLYRMQLYTQLFQDAALPEIIYQLTISPPNQLNKDYFDAQ